MKRRFYYSNSVIYGWTVYDREAGGEPAWNAIYAYTEPKTEPDGTVVYPSCVDLKSEYEAIKLCEYLNKQHEKEISQNA